jgi:hypothetical protein
MSGMDERLEAPAPGLAPLAGLLADTTRGGGDGREGGEVFDQFGRLGAGEAEVAVPPLPHLGKQPAADQQVQVLGRG